MAKKINIVIPAFNEAEMVNLFYKEVSAVINNISNYDFTFLFVDDGSRDETLNLVKALSKSDSRVKYLSFSRNFGKEAAMLAGLEYSQAMKVDAMLLMDADLQDPPSLIVDFLKYYEEGYQYIYTRNKTRKGQGFLKKVFAISFYKVYRFLTKDKKVVTSARDFALFDQEVIAAFLSFGDRRRYSKGIVSQIGFRQKCIEYDFIDRQAGTTKWNFRGLFKYARVGIEQNSRVYELVPNVMIIVFLALFGTSLGFLIANPSTLLWVLNALFLSFFLVSIILKYILKVVYDVRDQILERPRYLVGETNLNVKPNKNNTYN